MFALQEVMPISWWGMFGLIFVVLILLNVTFSLYRRMKKYEAAHLSLKTYLSGKSIDSLLGEYLGSVETIKNQVSDYIIRLEKTENKLRHGVDRVEMVRFSAFENMGSELSFAMALLNQAGNGVVLSSINNREESRVYAKPVVAGQSSYNLSAEERDVIAKAQQGEMI
ncbi:MAG: DUF4446 family protein [Desulfitobacteriaceae bacterium]